MIFVHRPKNWNLIIRRGIEKPSPTKEVQWMYEALGWAPCQKKEKK